MAKYIFWTAFLLATVFQGVRFINNPIGDQSIWTTAAETVHTGNPASFPKLDAYMHPGGPVIEGTIVVQALSKSSYDVAIDTFLVLFDSLCIAFICMLCYVLRKNLLWSVAVFGLLSFQPIYADSSLYFGLTPPSVVASLVISVLVLLTLYLYEHAQAAKKGPLVLWCVLAGLSAATRIDAGGVMALALLLMLATVYSSKKVFAMALGAFLAFCIFDPFMWFGPVTQVIGLFSSVLNHYAGSGQTSFLYYVYEFLRVSTLGIVSLSIGILLVLFRKEIVSPVPARFLAFLSCVTLFLSFIFLSAHSQASRYFLPLVFLWEIFLPLFVFSLISKIDFSFVKTPEGKENARFILKLLVLVLLIFPPAGTFVSEVVSYKLMSFL